VINHRADASDSRCNDVAIFEKLALSGTNAIWSSSENNVTWHQSRDPRQVLNQSWYIKDQIFGAITLAYFAIDIS